MSEGGIEKFVPRITDWHHKACPAMTNGDPGGRDRKICPSGSPFVITQRPSDH